MSSDIHDVQWTCVCGHTNPGFDSSCNGCGKPRYSESEEHPASVSSAYASEVRTLLTSGTTKTRLASEHPLLNEEESEEMVEDYLLHVPAKVFAAKLERRDIAMFEAVCDPCHDRAWPNAENE